MLNILSSNGIVIFNFASEIDQAVELKFHSELSRQVEEAVPIIISFRDINSVSPDVLSTIEECIPVVPSDDSKIVILCNNHAIIEEIQVTPVWEMLPIFTSLKGALMECVY